MKSVKMNVADNGFYLLGMVIMIAYLVEKCLFN